MPTKLVKVSVTAEYVMAVDISETIEEAIGYTLQEFISDTPMSGLDWSASTISSEKDLPYGWHSSYSPYFKKTPIYLTIKEFLEKSA